MKTWNVVLSAKAYMNQQQSVKAKTAEEATKIALKNFDNEVWKYHGVDEETVQVESVTNS